MTDHAEEQAMEAEALAAIFDTHFAMKDPQQWSIDLYPETTDDPSNHDLNHVAVRLHVTLPDHYPEVVPSQLRIEIIKGLTEHDHVPILTDLAKAEAEANVGGPSIFAIAERIKDWLMENNVKGLDDISMHAQMLRKQQQQAAAAAAQQQRQEFESQVKLEELTEAEREELQVRQKRAEGTPCTPANFNAWKAAFEAEMAVAREKAQQEASEDGGGGGGASGKNKAKSAAALAAEKVGRLTGYQYFSSKATNLEALEAAAEQAGQEQENDEDEDEGELDDVNEDLFDEDVDVDDLDFDDDEEDEDGEDEEEEVDI